MVGGTTKVITYKKIVFCKNSGKFYPFGCKINEPAYKATLVRLLKYVNNKCIKECQIIEIIWTFISPCDLIPFTFFYSGIWRNNQKKRETNHRGKWLRHVACYQNLI